MLNSSNKQDISDYGGSSKKDRHLGPTAVLHVLLTRVS